MMEDANDVQESIKCRLWYRYIMQELSVLPLFDQQLSSDSREQIARAFLSTPKPQHFTPRRPTFQADTIANDDCELHHFIGPRSWLLFNLLHIEDYQWLMLHVDEWSSNEQYHMMEKL